MINVNFASNESFSGAGAAFLAALTPWNWFRLNAPAEAKNKQLLSQSLAAQPNELFFLLSARSALFGLLNALELKPNAEILVQGFTCEAVILPIQTLQLKPIYVDIEEKTFSADLVSIQAHTNKNTKVLILQHSFGMTPHDRTKILTWALENKIIVIEDLAHGWHTFSQNDPFQTYKLISFGRSKLFSVVHGGAVSIPDLQVRTRFAKWQAQLKNPSTIFILQTLLYKILTPVIVSTYQFGFGKILHKAVTQLGLFTKEMSSTEKHGKYDPWLEKHMPVVFQRLLTTELNQEVALRSRRNETALMYQSHLGDLWTTDNLPILRYPVLVPNRATALSNLKQIGVIPGTWYEQPIAPNQVPLASMEYRVGMCPTAEKISQNIINLPLNISPEKALEISQVLRKQL